MNISTENKEVVKSFFRFLEQNDAEGVANLFAEDGIHINPYASGLFPESVRGRTGIKAYWEGPIANFDGMTFPIEQLLSMEDNMVFVKFTRNINLKDGGLYSNDYYATFKLDSEHKISEYVEIFNPIVAARGFGMIDQIS